MKFFEQFKNPARKEAEEVLASVMDELDRILKLSQDYRREIIGLLAAKNKELLPPDGMTEEPSMSHMFNTRLSFLDQLLNFQSHRLLCVNTRGTYVKEFSGSVIEVSEGKFGVALAERTVTKDKKNISVLPQFIYPDPK